jgi:hypothetical protein
MAPAMSARIVKTSLLLAVLSLGVFGGGMGCKSNPVGRECFVEGAQSDAGVSALTVVGSPALDCQSRTCLHVASKEPDLCTASCDSDSDCDTSPESPCKMGFACMVPVVVGNFCCEKLCVCKDYLLNGTAPPTPEACDPTVPANECCNLSGRRGNAQYPACK